MLHNKRANQVIKKTRRLRYGNQYRSYKFQNLRQLKSKEKSTKYFDQGVDINFRIARN